MLDALSAKVSNAELSLDKARERNDSGEIDLASHGAEAASARIIISLSEALVQMYAKAVTATDIYALRSVAKAAEKLIVDSDDLLRESVYPSDPHVRKSVILQNIGLAKSTYAAVVASLDNTHVELGVSIPAFPSTV
jgi:hypothetical protein